MSKDFVHAKGIVWKQRAAPRSIDHDGVMKRVVNVIKDGNESLLFHWMNTCDDINVRDSWGNAALHWAAALGKLNAVTHLLLAQADVNAVNMNGATPLHCAAICGHSNIIRQLLRSGADVMATNHEGQTMIDLLRYMGWDNASIQQEHSRNVSPLSPSGHENLGEELSFSDGAFLGSLTAYAPPDSPYVYEVNVEVNNHHHDLRTKEIGEPLCVENDASNDVAGEDLVCMQWHAEMEQLFSRESAERNELISKYAKWMLQVTDTMKSDHSAPTEKERKEVGVVLDAKYSPQGSDQFLVHLTGDADSEELRVKADDVKDSPVAKAYVEPLKTSTITPNISGEIIGGDVLLAREHSEDAEQPELPSLLRGIPCGNSQISKSAPVSNVPNASIEHLPPLRISPSMKSSPALLVNEKRPTDSLSLPSCNLVTGILSQNVAHGDTPHNSILTISTHSDKNKIKSSPNSSPANHINCGEKTLPPLKLNKVNYNAVASVREASKIRQGGVFCGEKRNANREYLSEEEKRIYEEFLRRSALRYLGRIVELRKA
ncbi:hypothetical protein C3747_55g146 [Trypanosoma cruzi]|uniref:Uncharacterized protein n=2 Tax=Trypanosoma cruzi TaxID=5693 RepID=Q4CPL2_TRYCC|nr:hypothetical protein, conserved [Trypanosoma cruzi]EAN82212.1 hypothetical protein, conserved [Trypanosoma cruzi]PWV11962.1 hypothetical protein C3747_55g146 [Trypanosoma cruzi]RNC60520.1 LmrCD-specific DARPin [Trypanosoma cruzi]|eukprot:XP_804063.1 hypothetical protein [Trypanosoma cruzi strain CL Brener]